MTERKWEIEDSNGSTIHVHSHAPSVGDGALIHVLIIIDALERVAEVLCDAREGRDGGGGGVTPIVVVQVELLPTGFGASALFHTQQGVSEARTYLTDSSKGA